MQHASSVTAPVSVLLLTAALGAQTVSMDDAMWIAARQGRTLTKVHHSGAVLQTVDLTSNGLDLSRVCRAPNGDLWVINFITPTLTIVDRNGQNLRNLNLGAIGSPTNIVFDKNGVAWATFNGAGLTARFASDGTLLTTIPTPGFPLGITIDNQGFVWVGHRTGPPSQVTKIDPVTFGTQVFPMPAGSTSLGGFIMADSPGIVGKSKIWHCGDRANEMFVLDDQGNLLTKAAFGTALTGGGSDMTQDRFGNVWVEQLTTGIVFGLDRNTYATVQSFLDPVGQPINVCTDSYGRPWFVNRVSFSGPQPSELRRIDRTGNNVYEVTASIGIGAYNPSDPNGYMRALVTVPLGDFDGDGVPNVIECQQGTSPYDPQSNSNLSILVNGKTAIGSTITIDMASIAPTQPIGIATATGLAAVPFTLTPAIAGKVRLDPLKFLPLNLNSTIPGKITLPLPNDPALVGFLMYLQAAVFLPTPQLSNETGILVQ